MNTKLEERPDDLTAYLDLNGKEVSKIIVWLLIEESLRGRLSVFREEHKTGVEKQRSETPVMPGFLHGTINRLTKNDVPLMSVRHGQ